MTNSQSRNSVTASASAPKSAAQAELDTKMKGTFGNPQQDVINQLSSRLPGMGPKLTPYGYTSEEEIREKILEVVARPVRKFSEKQMAAVGIDQDPLLQSTFTRQRPLNEDERLRLAEEWIKRHIASAKKRDRLMTSAQLADWRLGRKLTVGDRARYIGPTRNEPTQSGLLVPREHGQTGFITNVMESRHARLITFHPDQAVAPLDTPDADKQLVDLQVREHTAGWLSLERVDS